MVKTRSVEGSKLKVPRFTLVRRTLSPDLGVRRNQKRPRPRQRRWVGGSVPTHTSGFHPILVLSSLLRPTYLTLSPAELPWSHSVWSISSHLTSYLSMTVALKVQESYFGIVVVRRKNRELRSTPGSARGRPGGKRDGRKMCPVSSVTTRSTSSLCRFIGFSRKVPTQDPVSSVCSGRSNLLPVPTSKDGVLRLSLLLDDHRDGFQTDFLSLHRCRTRLRPCGPRSGVVTGTEFTIRTCSVKQKDRSYQNRFVP